jgi:hypothetical protein
MLIQGYKPLQIKSKHSFPCICSKKKKNQDSLVQPQSSSSSTLKNGSYPQIGADIELRKPNPKPKLDIMNDRHVSNLPLHATTVLANLPLHANLLESSSSVVHSPVAEAKLLHFSNAVSL